jgi:hypothetical protein
MHAKRVDSNHKELTKALRDMGCSVFDTSRVAGGFPDVVCGKNGVTVLVEFKSSVKAKFTAAQDLFILNWRGSPVVRINNIDDAINLVKSLEKS